MLTGRTVALVVNPTAGRGLAARLLPEIQSRLRGRGADVTVLLGRDFAESAELVATAVADKPDVLAVVGGDGMMHLGVNACTRRDGVEPPPTLALVPAGTGNDICRGLGFDVRDTLAAVDAVGAADPVAVDVGLYRDAEGKEAVVGSIVASGFDALVNQRANAMRRPKGSMRYTIAAIAELATFSPLHYELVVDGEPRRLDAMFVAVGTTSTYGGGMQICLGADPRDGLLDVTIIKPVGRATLLRLLPRMRSGTFASDPCVEQLRCREVRVGGRQADGAPLVTFGDGEPLGAPPFTLSALPGALSVFLPA